MSKYLIVIEETGTGFSAYSPDIPGCVSTGASRAEVERQIGCAYGCNESVLTANAQVQLRTHRGAHT